MHYITDVHYESDFKLRLQFEDKDYRMVDLKDHLDGEIFEPLTDVIHFRTAHLNSDIDTVVWENGADMSPDFLYEISVPLEEAPLLMVAEEPAKYNVRKENSK